MARWKRTKELNDHADRIQIDQAVGALYRELFIYIKKYYTDWRFITATIDLLQPEPLYNTIVTGRHTDLAPPDLIEKWSTISEKLNTFTISEDILAVVQIELDSREAGSYEFSTQFLTQSDVIKAFEQTQGRQRIYPSSV